MGRVEAVVENEFGCWEMSDPVIVTCVGEEAEMSFDFLISAFCLTIGLGVVSYSQHVSNPEFIVKTFHEVRGELRATIGYNFVWDSMEAEDFFVINVCDAIGVDIR